MKSTFTRAFREHSRQILLAFFGIASLLGAVLATLDLFRGMQQAEALYTVGIAGLSVEGDLQRYIQESRRTFIYALTTTDPNRQLPYIQSARAADRQVVRLYGAFSAIHLDPESREALARFDREWHDYLPQRDEMISLILEDRADEALDFDSANSTPTFEKCALTLANLKQLLDRYAGRQLEMVRRTYYRSAGEIAVLLVTILLLIGSLRKLAELRKSHLELSEAEKLERERSQILEMVSRNRALPDVLEALARLVERQRRGLLCSISLLRGGVLSCAASPSVPADRVLAVESGALARLHQRAGDAMYRLDTAGWDQLSGSQSWWSVPIQSVTGTTLGLLSIHKRHSHSLTVDERAFLLGIARLAALAIEHREVNEKLAFQAQHDPLTGLPNRAMFHDQLAQALASDTHVAIVWIDLDRFKQVNDLRGHHVGDLLLKEVARKLEECVRENDIVARIGGDEFVLLLRQLRDDFDPLEVARRVIASLNRPIAILEHSLTVTASLGISRYPEHGHTPEVLLRNADTAMYRAKFQGRDMFEVFDAQMGSASCEMLEIETGLRCALENNEFELYYQPQVDPGGGISGVEALIRWHSPELGTVSPARFIPVAEENGLIITLGHWVLREACLQAAAWRRAGLPQIRMSVNVSPRQMVRPDFPDTVAAALHESGFPAALLELELTETAMMRNLDDSIDTMRRLREMGVRLAIDDFGAGNAGLTYLRQLPVDVLKIDRSFIKDMESPSQESLSVIRAIISLAHGLRLQVVAEGVENEAQSVMMKQEACDLIQGFFYYRPMPAQAMTAELHARSIEKAQQWALECLHQ